MAFDLLSLPCTGRTLVEASAGTGKTYTISTLLVRLLLEQRLRVEQILVVTFTEAATAELRQRIRERLSTALLWSTHPEVARKDDVLAQILQRLPSAQAARWQLEQALADFDRAPILTIHGFCRRVLTDNAFRTRAAFNAELLKDTRELSQEVLLDFWAQRVAPSSVYFAEYLQQAKFKVSELGPYSHWAAGVRPLRILPGTLPVPSPIDASAFEAAYWAARNRFEEAALCKLLLNSNLNGNLYRKTSIPKWCQEFAAYLRSERPSLTAPECLRKFRPAAMLAAQTKSAGSRAPEHAFFDACERLAQARENLQAALDEHFLVFKSELIATLQSELPERKRSLGVVSFDDLLHQVHDALYGPDGEVLSESLHRDFPVALIDEFQDTDPTQYAIFDKIYKDPQATLFLIGDPKQAIYSFRGADIFAYLKAASSVPSDARHTMATNYRSDPALIAAVGKLFSRASHPFDFGQIHYPQVHARPNHESQLQLSSEFSPAPLQFRFLARGETERSLGRAHKKQLLPALVAADVAELLNSQTRLGTRRLEPQDFAVLTRTNEEAFDCQRALLALGIPAVVLGDRSVYEQPDAAELQLLLKAIAEPGHTRAVRTALVTELIGLSAEQLLELDRDEQRWDDWVDRFRRWNERWHQHGFVQMMRQVLTECGLPQKLLSRVDGERRMTNLLQLIELLHTEAMDSHLGPNGLMHFLANQRHDRLNAVDSEQIRLESDADAVILTTIHKSKGLEYPIVLLPHLHNSLLVLERDKRVLFHDPDADDQLSLDIGTTDTETHKQRMRQEALAENLRLLYVALTRAKHRCLVYWGAFWNFETAALSYLLYGGELANQAGSTTEALKERIKEFSDQQLFDEIRHLDPSNLELEIQFAARSQPAPYNPRSASPGSLQARPAPEQRALGSRTTSFSALIAHAPVEGDLLDGRDRDDLVSGPEPATPHAEMATTLALFPGGTRTGNLFHAVLEHCDFQAQDHSALIQTALVEHGVSGPLTTPADQTLSQALQEVLSTPFAPGLSLSCLTPKQRLNEMEFTLPAPEPAQGLGGAISNARLASAFRDHPSAEVPSGYADSLARLGFTPLLGFLKGFIDLVFVHEDRWYVVDYKTNYLGLKYEDYAPAQLGPAMQRGHYVLQYHLYCLAVHRYLQVRKPGYDYERDFGGAYDLFLRGMHPDHGARTGVFFEKPPWARLQALSDLFVSQPVSQSRPALALSRPELQA